jgi:RND family efflux transporter MFP subunit
MKKANSMNIEVAMGRAPGVPWSERLIPGLTFKVQPNVSRLLVFLALTCISISFCHRISAAELTATSAPGLTEPFLDVTLSAPVPGIITSLKLREGAPIQEGDLLLELDKRLEELEVERRKLVRDQKRSDYEGTKKLFGSTRGVSKEELEKKEVEYKVANVEHDMAAEQLRRRQLISPLTGTITEVLLEVGESCQPYQALVRVVDTRRCYFVTNIEARQAAKLKTGQTLRLELEVGAGPGTTSMEVQGTISFLSPVVDPASGLRRVKLLFDNANGRVVPGVAGRLLLD